MEESTLKDATESLAVIKSSMETIHERLEDLNRWVHNPKTRYKNQEALSFKIPGVEESHIHISKEFEDQRRIKEKTKNKKHVENENFQLSTWMNNLEKLVFIELKNSIQLKNYIEKWLKLEALSWKKERIALELQSKSVLLLEWLITTF